MPNLNFIKDIKDLKKTEIWGVIIIAVLNLSAIIVALSNLDKIGINSFFLFFVILQACLIPLYIMLFLLYIARLGVDDMHEAARNIHITMDKMNELLREMPETQKITLQTLELLKQEAMKKDI